MRTILMIFGLQLISLALFSQDARYYWVEFKNKKDSQFSTERPEDFLSARAIERRQKQNIPITENDLPVNSQYLKVLKYYNAKIQHTSKWLNAATILAKPADIKRVRKLHFVKSVAFAGKHFLKSLVVKDKSRRKRKIPFKKNYYGYANAQIEFLQGDFLHQQGYKGQGMLIAILDAGFHNFDRLTIFEHLNQNEYPFYTKDFIENDDSVFESSVHGTEVMSVIGSNTQGFMVGTAPEAGYVLIKTEDSRGEFRMDECNWIAGLEYADSIGADVVNSSLGYTLFDEKSMNYSHYDLNGETALVSKAADIAFSKGMIIVNSAGNEGNISWKQVSCPSDAEHVLAVGAVDKEGTKMDYSSIGPTSDNRIKPDVVALGENIFVFSPESGKITLKKGTSFTAPIVAGLVTALWQAFPEKTNQEIINAIKQTSSNAQQPNNLLGYGVPDFSRAYYFLKTDETSLQIKTDSRKD